MKSHKVMVAIKVVESQMMHLMKSSPKSLLLLKQQQQKQAFNSCTKCVENAFETLSDVQVHFTKVHKADVSIKDISIDETQKPQKVIENQGTKMITFCKMIIQYLYRYLLFCYSE